MAQCCAEKVPLETYLLTLAFALAARLGFLGLSLPVAEGAEGTVGPVDAFTLLRPVLWYDRWRNQMAGWEV